jgi:hypothetical protein
VDPKGDLAQLDGEGIDVDPVHAVLEHVAARRRELRLCGLRALEANVGETAGEAVNGGHQERP